MKFTRFPKWDVVNLTNLTKEQDNSMFTDLPKKKNSMFTEFSWLLKSLSDLRVHNRLSYLNTVSFILDCCFLSASAGNTVLFRACPNMGSSFSNPMTRAKCTLQIYMRCLLQWERQVVYPSHAASNCKSHQDQNTEPSIEWQNMSRLNYLPLPNNSWETPSHINYRWWISHSNTSIDDKIKTLKPRGATPIRYSKAQRNPTSFWCFLISFRSKALHLLASEKL